LGLWQHTILGIHYSVPQKLSENHFTLKEYNMGLIRTTITLNNPAKQDVQPIDVNSLVDTGALHLCIPEHVALQLNLKEIEQREVVLADLKVRILQCRQRSESEHYLTTKAASIRSGFCGCYE
jgi:clan AA aspartic protease